MDKKLAALILLITLLSGCLEEQAETEQVSIEEYQMLRYIKYMPLTLTIELDNETLNLNCSLIRFTEGKVTCNQIKYKIGVTGFEYVD